MGVWIETYIKINKGDDGFVTPYVGVWIETHYPPDTHFLEASHPTWVCGLKPKDKTGEDVRALSHPTWVCGLKHISTIGWVIGNCHTLRGCVD